MSTRRMPDTEALLANADWVRALARRLVSDAHGAEDVAQDALTSALQHPPRRGNAMRAFLRTIVTNLARRRFRDERHRALREERSAREEALVSTADVVERLGTHKVVVAAVESLDEPYRAVILLRYFDGLPPRAIAAELHVPVKTIDTRLHRGLQILRGKLERDLGDDRDPRLSALFLLFPRRLRLTRWTSPAALGKALLVSTQVKAITGVILAAVCLLLLWRTSSFLQPESRRDDVVARSQGTGNSAPIADGSRPGDREQLSPMVEGATNANGLSSSIDVLDLAGRVVDSGEHPVVGARIEVVEKPVVEMWSVESNSGANDSHAAGGVSDEHGEFAFPLAIGRPYMLRVEADGFVPRDEIMLRAGQRVVVKLSRAASIRGHVLSAADRVPIPTARVTFMNGSEPTREVTVRTDANGAFTIAGVGAGRQVGLSAQAEHWGTKGVVLDLHEGDAITQDIELLPGRSVSGTVRDTASRRGIAGAMVYVMGNENWPQTKTDADGRFVLDGIGAAAIQLRVRCAGRPSIERRVRMDKDVIEGVDFDLESSRIWRGRIVSSDGKPVADAWVAAQANAFQGDDFDSVRTRADGTFELTHLRSDVHHLLIARKEHAGATTLHLPDPLTEASPREMALPDVVLLQGALLSGAVVDEDGSPIDDVVIDISSRGRDRFKLAALPADEDQFSVEWREVRTDAHGRFAFADLAPGTCQLMLHKAGIADIPEVQVDLAEGEMRRDLRVVIDSSISIGGRVVDADGNPCASASVQIERESDNETVGWGSSDAQGRFRVMGLEPGRYWVFADPQYDDDGSFRTISGMVRGVSTGTRDVLVVIPRVSWIEGTVVGPDGAPVPHALVYGFDFRSVAIGTTLADENGHFRYKVAVDTVTDLKAGWTKANEDPYNNTYVAIDDESSQAHRTGIPAGQRDLVLKLGPHP